MASSDDDDMGPPLNQPKWAKISRSSRASLIFPVGRIGRYLRRGEYADRIRSGASVYMAAVLQYLTYDILDIAGAAASRDKRQRIAPKHLVWTVGNDDELHNLLGHLSVPQARVSRKPCKTQIAMCSWKGKSKMSARKAVAT